MLPGCNEQQAALCLSHHFHANVQVLGWPERGSLLCPFNYANAITVKIVFKSQINHLLSIIQTVQIEVIESRPERGWSTRKKLTGIFLEQDKGRAVDVLRDAHALGQPLRKGCLAGSQLSIEQDEFSPLQ